MVPGANVGCDLVLWLLLLGTGILLALSARDNIRPFNYGYDYECEDVYSYYCRYDLDEYEMPSNHRQGVAEAVGSGFVFVVMYVGGISGLLRDYTNSKTLAWLIGFVTSPSSSLPADTLINADERE